MNQNLNILFETIFTEYISIIIDAAESRYNTGGGAGLGVGFLRLVAKSKLLHFAIYNCTFSLLVQIPETKSNKTSLLISLHDQVRISLSQI